MTYRGNYIPKRRKVNYKRVVPFIIVLAIVVGLIVGHYYKPQKDTVEPSYAFCNMTDNQSQTLLLGSNNQDAINLGDYSLYGDALSLYANQYEKGITDPFVGRTIFLKNLCYENQEEVLLLGQGLDGQIRLSNLKPGFYEIRILDGFERVRLASAEPIETSFYSVTKNNESKHVKLVANKDLFKAEGLEQLDKNYLYLDVRQEETPEDRVDVVLDANGFYDDGTGYIYPGLVIDGFHEGNDLYTFTYDVKTLLESRGYRVALSRDNTTPISIHGENGRIARAYNQKAKYYIHFTMLFDTRSTTKGATMIYSNYASNLFAQTMLTHLQKTGLPLYDFGVGTPGITKTGFNDGFDFNAILRETGGIYTGAGMVNERYQTLNAFAKNNKHGVQGLIVELGYASNPETLNLWKTEYDAIVENVANGIEAQLNQ